MNQFLILDGGMGTMLQKAGLAGGELPELINLTHPETVTNIHLSYLEAGAQVVTANTFGANSYKLGDCGHSVEELVTAAISLAKQAVAQSGKEARVALDIGPLGQLLAPLGTLSFEDAVSIFARTVKAGVAAGADLVLIETMSDLYEAKAAVLAAKENCSLPVWCTMTFDEHGRTLTGSEVPAVVATLEGLRCDAIGLNCGRGPMQSREIARLFSRYASVPVIVQPNAGMPVYRDGQTTYDIDAAEFAAQMREIAGFGVQMLGGCCGTTPDHIQALTQAVADLPFYPPTYHNHTIVCSYAKWAEACGMPLVVGERINPTGKKKFKEALRAGDMDYILNEALAQTDAGCDILDVNVGIPDIDETAMMIAAVQEIQAVTSIPLQLDSSSPQTLAAAMRIYNGKPVVNAVNGKQEVMEQVFPLIAKYGGVVIGLTLDENGIPSKAEERFAIAEKIVTTAAKYGIATKDIVIDTLTLTASAQQEDVMETVRALSMVKEKLGVKTVLGVSNVSFGLPARETVNATFLTIALHEGLDFCIINPRSEIMMGALRAYNVLANHDKHAEQFIAAMGNVSATTPAVTTQENRSLAELVRRGLKDEAALSATRALDAGESPMSLIEQQIMPALDDVGRQFEQKTMFLPQLIQSAETAKAAFAVIRERMPRAQGESKGKTVLATVYGDVHDIGKNIVKLLLENYGFDVIDLGKNVPAEQVVETVKAHNIRLLGLSALMTTTVVNMEDTIQKVRAACPDCRIVVGGAVLTADYADQIGADFYGEDALATVRIAEQVFSKN